MNLAKPRRVASRLLLCLVAATALPTLAAGMYSWVDANGVKHYSDQPPPPKARDAKKLRLAGKGDPIDTAMPSETVKPSEGQAMARAAGYEEQDIKRNCEVASKNLIALTSAAPLPEGSEAANNRQQSVVKAQSQVKLFCE